MSHLQFLSFKIAIQLAVVLLVGSYNPLNAQTEKRLARIAFGSCAKERQEQPIWEDIIAKDPELFLMIGDNHYADFWVKNGKMVMEPVPNVERIREAYQTLGKQPGFIKIKRHCPLLAVWDDHDFGANDMGNDFQFRKESQVEFCDFYGFAKDAPIRQQEGVYQAKMFGPEDQRVQVILLDTRYHRDTLERDSVRPADIGPYKATADTTKTILGETQWKWLEEQLKQPAAVRLIASSIQIIANEHGWETWGNFPHEQQRLYDLIRDTKANGIVFLSGDRHLLEISLDDSSRTPYPIWDFTSSGLTQKKEQVGDPNRFRVGPVVRETNFGVIRLDWGDDDQSTRIHMEGYGSGGKLITRQTVLLNQLRVQ